MKNDDLNAWHNTLTSAVENLYLLLNRELFREELQAADRATAESVVMRIAKGLESQFAALAEIESLYTLHPDGKPLFLTPDGLDRL